MPPARPSPRLRVGVLTFVAVGTLAGQRGLAQAPPRIRNIRIESGNVFQEAETSFLARAADAMHGVTREEVIRRELLFDEGEPLDLAKIGETERKLRAHHFFRSVEIRVEPVGGDEVDVVVETRDAWTTEVGASLGREGGRSRFGIHFEENNLFGRGKRLTLALAAGADRTTREIVYGDPQFLGRPLSFEIAYGINSDGERRRLSLEGGFRSLDAPSGGSLAFEDWTRQARTYQRGVEAERFAVASRTIEVAAGRLFTLPDSRPIVRLHAGFRREEADFSALPEAPGSDLPDDRRFGFLFTRLELLDPDYVVERDVARASREEDFDLGGSYWLELAYSPAALAADEAFGARLGLTRGLPFRNGFLQSSLKAFGRLRAGEIENAFAEAELDGVWRPGGGSLHTLVARAVLGAGANLDRDFQLFADGATGLRGYRLHAFAGNRRVLFNLEDRVWLTAELLHLFRLGGAVFLDSGYAWPEGSRLRLSDLRTDVGIGLRFGLPRASRHTLLRLDLAYAVNADPLGRRGWLVSFSSSQAF